MNLKESINNGSFIKDLTTLLEQKPEAEKTNFEQFDTQLWYFLCGLKTRSKTKLEKEMQIRDKYFHNGNIGNLRMEIFNHLGISFMI